MDLNKYKVGKCRSCSLARLISATATSDECLSCFGHGHRSPDPLNVCPSPGTDTGSAVAATVSNERQSPPSTSGPSLAHDLNAVKVNGTTVNGSEKNRVQQKTHVTETLEAIYDLTTEITSKIKSIDEKILTPDGCSKSVYELQNEIRKLTVENHHLQQRLLDKTIEIRGIPAKNKESLLVLIIRIGTALGVPVELSDIDNVTRSRSGKSSSCLPLIVVSFTRSSTVQRILSAARKLQRDFTTEDLGWCDGTVHRIYFHESLTSHSKNLFMAVRAAKKNNIIKHAWTRHGTVYIRKADDTPVIRVTTIEDIPGRDA